MQIEATALPFFSLGTNSSRLSKYLVDFFERGGKRYLAVVRDSCIRDDNLYRMLEDTSLCLLAIRECLKAPEDSSTPFSRGLDLLATRFRKHLLEVAVV